MKKLNIAPIINGGTSIESIDIIMNCPNLSSFIAKYRELFHNTIPTYKYKKYINDISTGEQFFTTVVNAIIARE